MWYRLHSLEFLNTDRWVMLGKAFRSRRDIVFLLCKFLKVEAMLPEVVDPAEAGCRIDLISTAIGIVAAVVRAALQVHRTGKRPLGRVGGRCR